MGRPGTKEGACGVQAGGWIERSARGIDRGKVPAASIGLAATVVGLLALMIVPAFASAAGLEHAPRGIFGSAEQPTFTEAAGMAVDQSTGDVLVIDPGTGALLRYHEDGTPANFTCTPGPNCTATGNKIPG